MKNKVLLLCKNKKMNATFRQILSLLGMDIYDYADKFGDVPDKLCYVSPILSILGNNEAVLPDFSVIERLIYKMVAANKSCKIVLITNPIGEKPLSYNNKKENCIQASIMLWWKSMAAEVAKSGANSNIISMGYADFIDENVKKEFLGEYLKHIVIRRSVCIYDLCNALKLLLSDDVSYMVGQVIPLEGGLRLNQVSTSGNYSIEKSSSIKNDCSDINYDLEGKVALIVGCSSGIGEAIAIEYGKRGASICCFARSGQKLETLAEKIRRGGRRCIVIDGDVTKEYDIRKSIEKAYEEFGKIDILVYSAGYIELPSITNIETGGWEYLFKVNFSGYLNFCKLLIDIWIKIGVQGKIVGISSIDAKNVPCANVEIYGASKAAMSQLTRCLAMSYGRYGITANTISPGVIRTQMTQWINEGYKTRWNSHIMQGREGEPYEVAGLAVYLGSDASNFITGENLYVDGGYDLGYLPEYEDMLYD